MRSRLFARVVGLSWITFVIAFGTFTCDSPENPYRQPENVRLTVSVLSPPTDSVYRVQDTVRIRVLVHLPYLVSGPLLVSCGADTVTIPLPTSESVVDFLDTVRRVFPVPDTYSVRVSLIREDGVEVGQSLSVRIAGRPPRIEAQSPATVSAAESSPCTLWVAASGTGELRYVWTKSGAGLGGNSPLIAFDSVRAGDAGVYRCVVSSVWGADTSEPMALTVMPSNWLAPPRNLRIVRNDSVLIVAWDIVSRAERYRVYYYDTAYAASAPCTDVSTTLFEADTVRTGAYIWVRALAGAVASDPSDTLRVRRMGPCVPIRAGSSLNQAIRQASSWSSRPQLLCPEPGFYEQGTVRVFGVVKIRVE